MATNGVVTSTYSSRDSLTSSQLLSASATLSSTPSARQASQITKIYRQSSTLFLTRRLPESLSTISPVITPPAGEDGSEQNEAATPPIAHAPRSTRIKVWSLYLTILNAIVELDAEEGKQAFGLQEWRSLVSKVRNGDVWDEVVKHGYGGVEAAVDADVVINLATLLLAHAPTQTLNQQKLEAYLAASSRPNLDLSEHFNNQTPADPREAFRRANSRKSNGTDTPRDLNARVKILELYTLHVLLRNNEWDYSREFISMSEVLDEERREAFLQALQSLQDEQLAIEQREQQAQREQEEALKREIEEQRRQKAKEEELERQRIEQERLEQEKLSQRAGSEVDYGIEDAPSVSSQPKSARKRTRPGHAKSNSSSMKGRAKAAPKAVAAPGLLRKAEMIVGNVHKMVEGMALSFRTNPMILLRLLAFIVGLLIVLGRRDLRERLQRTLGSSWNKVKATVGMGVKVSYI